MKPPTTQGTPPPTDGPKSSSVDEEGTRTWGYEVLLYPVIWGLVWGALWVYSWGVAYSHANPWGWVTG